jgi:hypothetical protein
MVEPSTDASGPTKRLVQQSVQGGSWGWAWADAFCWGAWLEPTRKTRKKRGIRPVMNRRGRKERFMTGLRFRLKEVLRA